MTYTQIYLDTLAVISALATPFLLVMLLRLWSEALKFAAKRHEHQAEAIKKTPPFDDHAEFYEVPNHNMIGLRLFKNDKPVWEGAVYQIDRQEKRGPIFKNERY